MKTICNLALLAACLSLTPVMALMARESAAQSETGKWDRKLGNAQLELQFQRRGDLVAVQRVVNKLSGRTIPITGDDFSLGIEGREPLRSADFAFQEARTEAMVGGRRLTLRLKNASP